MISAIFSRSIGRSSKYQKLQISRKNRDFLENSIFLSAGFTKDTPPAKDTPPFKTTKSKNPLRIPPPLQNDQTEKSISNTPLPKNTPLVKMQIILYNFLNMYILAHIFQSIFLFPNVKCIFAHKRSIYGEV